MKPSSIRGADGRLLGLSFDDGYIDRDVYESFEAFLCDFAMIVSTRIPKDTDSEHAMRMIKKDIADRWMDAPQ